MSNNSDWGFVAGSFIPANILLQGILFTRKENTRQQNFC